MVDKTQILGQPLPPAGFLVERRSGRREKIHNLGHVTKIGRDPRGDIILDHESVSGQHAVVKFENGRFFLYDLASTNRTLLNNKAIQKQMLMDGDTIQVGVIMLVFKETRS